MTSSPKALNLRFPDPAQRAAIEAAARQEGMSLQEYILRAAVDRATAVEKTFLAAFQTSQARSGEAFRDLAELDPAPERRAAEQTARRDLDGPAQGHAA
ncbi:type II toxin -antitoxin system TacA 1-like antitoxin [Streptomyces sp. NPDC055189]